MSDEPLAREREPIERVRARLEALVMANAAPRCGARSKRTGKPCRAAAMRNGRCKVHGGNSTGPRTPEGLLQWLQVELAIGWLHVRRAKNGSPSVRALQAWLGHRNIQHTVRYTELAPDRFKNFWR